MPRQSLRDDPLLKFRLTAHTFIVVHGSLEWVVRVAGYGFAVRDHRVVPALYSERENRAGRRLRTDTHRYLHVGPICLAYLGHLRG